MARDDFDFDDPDFEDVEKLLDKFIKKIEEKEVQFATMTKAKIRLIIVGVALVFAVIAFFTLLKIETVEGRLDRKLKK